MKNNKKNILIWLLSWAVLFLVVIYSPIGSPELYRPNNYVVYSQGVSFKGGIANAPTSHSYQQSQEPELAVPINTDTHKSYAVNASAVTLKSASQTSYGVYASSNNAGSVASSQGGGSGGGGVAVGLGSKSSLASSTSQSVAVSSLSTDLNLAQNPTSRQSVGYTPNTGGTDPGDDPIGPGLPIGDGFWILLLMAGAYAFWKRMI